MSINRPKPYLEGNHTHLLSILSWQKIMIQR